MLLSILTATALLLFVIGVVTDPRRFINAVFLGLFVVLLGLALASALRTTSLGFIGMDAVFSLMLVPAVLTLAVCLILNGVQMIRKEGRRLAHLLSLLAGISILSAPPAAAAVSLFPDRVIDSNGLRILFFAILAIPMVVSVYSAFLFVCFVAYGFLYNRLRVRTDLDYIVVLGSGLVGGNRVPPLLASRLEKARDVYEEQVARGNAPVLITSGGQGPDESLPEAHAMAQYLIDRGVPAGCIEREAESRTTDENLRFSKAIMQRKGTDYRCVVVTNDFHAFRAALIARATGIRGQVLGSPTAFYFRPSAIIREFAAVVLSHKIVNLVVCLTLSYELFLPGTQFGEITAVILAHLPQL
ncbi:YdcF family protein [Streptomyces sp. NPDC059862]|uniref:YdcF family protein n=1 Tax=Streptomyces sp. NPDC059862 TaxID=3346975 RepID=UPI0036640112